MDSFVERILRHLSTCGPQPDTLTPVGPDPPLLQGETIPLTYPPVSGVHPEPWTKAMLGFPQSKENRGEEESLKKEQIVSILREAEPSTVTATARKHGVAEQSLYRWRR